jgi:hypothetical protein
MRVYNKGTSFHNEREEKMDELIKLVSKKVGIPEDKARLAVNTVLGFLKDKLPAPIASQLEGFLGGSGSTGSVEDIAKNLGGLLGKK